MRKSTLVLGALLGISALVNILALSRLSQRPDAPAKSDRKSSGAVAGSREAEKVYISDNADTRAILKELREMRAELASLKGGGSADSDLASADGVQPRVAGGSDLPAAVRDDPALMELMREQEALGKLWKDLGKLWGLQKSLGDAKYKDLVLKVTSDFLQIDPGQAAAFASAAERMQQELEAAMKEYQEAYKGITWDQNDKESWQRVYKELSDKYQARQKQAMSQLDGLLGDSPRHKQFREQAATWAYYLNPKGNAWQGDWGAWDQGEGE